MKRRWIAIALILLYILALPAAARMPEETMYVAPFTDVLTEDYYAEPVLWALEEAITKGTSGTTFSPEATCTTAQILTFLYRMQEQPDKAENTFDHAIAWAQEASLIDPEGFDPQAPCTRGQVITYFWKLAGAPELPAAAAEADWRLLLVNPWNKIPADYTFTARDLGGGQSVDERCADALDEMLTDCAAAGHTPVVISSYRTQATQEHLFYSRLNARVAQGMTRADAWAVTARATAVPGTSEHQIGLALDIVDSSSYILNSSQARTPAQQWLMTHSWEYGFTLRYPADKTDITGIIYEPWHYRYVGQEAAKAMYHQGICLEEYLALQTQYQALVTWAKEQGITTNGTVDSFLPAATCTRGQIVTFLYRMYHK